MSLLNVIDANFSIKCGGPETPSGGILYEAENSSMGPASFQVATSQKWAVSIVGLFADRQNPSYIEDTLSQIAGTNTPELYLTSRVSPSSIRYYGLGLQNGIYNISLLFAETSLKHRSSRIWESNGRRVFDIYIQVERFLYNMLELLHGSIVDYRVNYSLVLIV